MDDFSNAETGIVPREVALSMPGLEFLRGLLDGSLILPPFGKTSSIRLVSVEEGRVVFEGVPSREFYNPMGSVHGGWIATLLDTAMACAVQSSLKTGQTCTTLEMKTVFVRPVFENTGPLVCEGILLHAGGQIAGSEGRVYDGSGTLIAHGTETCLVLTARNGTG